MLKLIIYVLAIWILAAICGIDSCTCGYGPEIRKNLGLVETVEDSSEGWSKF